MRTKALLLIVSLGAAPFAMAQKTEPYAILSIGSKSCGTFLRANPQDKELYLGWAIGYISGVNTRSSGLQRRVGIDWERDASLVLLENFCTKDPLAAFHMAVESLRDEFGKKQGISTLK
jgi:hypothetical protein